MRLLPSDALPADPAGLHVLALPNDADPMAVCLDGVERVELHFPAFTDGRAYSQAVMLRRRRGFAGDIRATGEVLADQVPLMARCGFSSAALAAGVPLGVAQQQMDRFGDFYQGDSRQPLPRFARTTLEVTA